MNETLSFPTEISMSNLGEQKLRALMAANHYGRVDAGLHEVVEAASAFLSTRREKKLTITSEAHQKLMAAIDRGQSLVGSYTEELKAAREVIEKNS